MYYWFDRCNCNLFFFIIKLSDIGITNRNMFKTPKKKKIIFNECIKAFFWTVRRDKLLTKWGRKGQQKKKPNNRSWRLVHRRKNKIVRFHLLCIKITINIFFFAYKYRINNLLFTCVITYKIDWRNKKALFFIIFPFLDLAGWVHRFSDPFFFEGRKWLGIGSSVRYCFTNKKVL